MGWCVGVAKSVDTRWASCHELGKNPDATRAAGRVSNYTPQADTRKWTQDDFYIVKVLVLERVQKVADACKVCNSLLPSQSNGKPRNDKISFIGLEPMDILCVNQFAFNGNQFLAIKDYLSFYCLMVRLVGTDTNHVLRELNLLQAAFGRIKKLVTDNGPNLSSVAMES